MPAFNVYCKTEELWKMVVGIKPNIPSFFDLHTDFRTAWVTPDISIGDASDPNWAGFPIPIQRGIVYIFDDEIPALALGGAYHMRASIKVRDEDTDEVITLRIWHELLHAVGQPADDMVILASDWQTPFERILWFVWCVFGAPVDIPFWQSRYYAWLTKQAERDPLL